MPGVARPTVLPPDSPPVCRAADTSDADVAIVGAGAAGLATAIFTARRLPAARILLFDGAARLGTKLLVSGGGRCNVTNREVGAEDYWGGDRRVIGSVLRAFPAREAIRFFEGLGVPLHEEEDGKIFPDSNRARTVLEALVAEAGRLGVAIRAGDRVEGAVPTGQGFALAIRGRRATARRVVLAAGGLSLPTSGSDGSGLRMASALGHTIVPTTPALAPLILAGTFHAALAGVTHLAALTLRVDGGRPQRFVGPMVWTHFGVSGPLALNASRHWHRAVADRRTVEARLSFVPGREFSAVERDLLRAAADHPATSLRGAVSPIVPASVAEALVGALGLDGSTRLAHLSRGDRRRVCHALTDWPVPVAGSRGYQYAEATAGGVALDEVDRGTMASRRCPGLYLAGEMLDVDGRLGGFNFQWAWSSAWVAARGVCASLPRKACHG
jgi:hypothetical protein